MLRDLGSSFRELFHRTIHDFWIGSSSNGMRIPDRTSHVKYINKYTDELLFGVGSLI